ncbi:MAG TPA: Uma2 family endonuclease [Phycisphaerae bacterium]|jgi:Uma2 family endonuclease
MSFWDFQRAEASDDHLYELARGVVEVTDVPGRIHAIILHIFEKRLAAYDATHPGIVHYASGGAGAKIELPGMESERHPDRSIYLTPMPEDDYPWDKWVPSIVIEIVSHGAEAHERDYKTKREEYLAAGVQEYLIVDPNTRSMLDLTRHGDRWREQVVSEHGEWRPVLLPGFSLKCDEVFGALDRPGAR